MCGNAEATAVIVVIMVGVCMMTVVAPSFRYVLLQEAQVTKPVED